MAETQTPRASEPSHGADSLRYSNFHHKKRFPCCCSQLDVTLQVDRAEIKQAVAEQRGEGTAISSCTCISTTVESLSHCDVISVECLSSQGATLSYRAKKKKVLYVTKRFVFFFFYYSPTKNLSSTISRVLSIKTKDCLFITTLCLTHTSY